MQTHNIYEVPSNNTTNNLNTAGPSAAGSTDGRALQNPMYGAPLDLHEGSDNTILYNNASCLMNIYEGIPSKQHPRVFSGSRYSPEPYDVPAPNTDRSATLTAMVPDTGEYSQLEAGYTYVTPELVYEKPEEHYDDYSHLHHALNNRNIL